MLESVFEGGLLPLCRGRRIALEIARGLHHLHHKRIIHFDMKSANVLLTRDGTAKVAVRCTLYLSRGPGDAGNSNYVMTPAIVLPISNGSAEVVSAHRLSCFIGHVGTVVL